MNTVVRNLLTAAGVLALCVAAQGCKKAPPPVAQAAGGLPAEWRIPVAYQGEWRQDLKTCADAKDNKRVVIAADHLQIENLAGPVQASSTDGPHLTVVAALTGDGLTVQRAFVFDLADGQPNQMTTDVFDLLPNKDQPNAGSDQKDAKTVTFNRCPAA